MVFCKICKIVFMMGLALINPVFAKKTKRQIRKENIIYPMPVDSECYSEIDYCFNRYCFDKKTLTDGVYSKCGAISPANVLINVEECLKTRSVIKELDLTKGCKKVSYNRVLTLMENKDSMEKGLKKNSASCQYATNMLQAAKQCYAVMINSDGSFSRDLYDKLNSLCGERVSGEPDMVKRFFNAGDYGLSDVDMVNALKASGQNTVKRENWRQVVDATLAGYTEIAELSCGEEDYQITKVNDYLLDSRDNLAMIKMKEEAKQIGKKLGDKFVDRMFPGQTCKSQPLPEGGLMWYYSQNSNPNCKIICKEGFVVDRSFTKCNEPQEKGFAIGGINIGTDKQPKVSKGVVTFIGGTGYVEKKEEKQEENPKKDTRCNTPYTKRAYEYCCPKYTFSETPLIKQKSHVCNLFVKGGRLSKPYWRCKSDDPGNKERFLIHGKWYDITIQDLAKAFGKPDINKIGEDYRDGLSLYIKTECSKNLGAGGGKNPPTEENAGDEYDDLLIQSNIELCKNRIDFIIGALSCEKKLNAMMAEGGILLYDDSVEKYKFNLDNCLEDSSLISDGDLWLSNYFTEESDGIVTSYICSKIQRYADLRKELQKKLEKLKEDIESRSKK